MSKFICPYCFKELPEENSPCCGEVGHAIKEEKIEMWKQVDKALTVSMFFIAGMYSVERNYVWMTLCLALGCLDVFVLPKFLAKS